MKKFIYLLVCLLIFTVWDGYSLQNSEDLIEDQTEYMKIESATREYGNWSRFENNGNTAKVFTLQGKYDNMYQIGLYDKQGRFVISFTVQYREYKNSKYVYDLIYLGNNETRYSTVESTKKLSEVAEGKVSTVEMQMNIEEPNVENSYSKFKFSEGTLQELNNKTID
ncbi:hypothetical protein MATR_09760 [Marivirga tractuosa]|uniref:Uncharacterized protein n=1 Tax=Marivirga tractuosa (strain ATCC 23168 / DSM 4126 / NBRC 15989 / NCIMB 1408 / VKM B-1430 / H-43) TaxID=643867 RepID=E4TMW4_MARTH|nr:hypothetical protein [Marivirga tractuosa]ADR21395.1 hypothetical protein Ftrac_1405 [Marivirga tractuosa DSM 4126]BDD14151.1 hypothetical protein MATR_09760 [Marivirga tractuosa]